MNDKVKELELNKRFFQDCIFTAARDNTQDLIPYWNRKVKTINKIINSLKHDKQGDNGPKRVF